MFLKECLKLKFKSSDVENGLDIIGALAEKTGFLKSNGEAQKSFKRKLHFSK